MRWIFWGFCINWILIDPLHYISSLSDFSFELAEFFVIEKRLADSGGQGAANSPTWRAKESPILRLSKSGSRWLSHLRTFQVGESAFECFKKTSIFGESESCRVVESPSRGGAMVSQGVAIPNFLHLSSIFRILNSQTSP